MKKNDFVIVAVLVALMFAWMNFYPALERKFFPRAEQPVAQPAEPAAAAQQPAQQPAPETPPVSAPAAEPAPQLAAADPSIPEERLTLANDAVELTISSHGGAVVSAILKNYSAENRDGSGPATFDFSSAPALCYAGMPLPPGVLEKTADGLRWTVALGDRRFLERTFRLEGAYLLKVEDVFVNDSGAPWVLPALRLPTGPMREAAGTTAQQGLATLGVDSFTAADGVRHWGKDLGKLFRHAAGNGLLTATPEQLGAHAADWIAAKNKFFVQILTPASAARGFDLSVRREGSGKKTVPVEVSAALRFDSETVAAGESLTRSVRAYTGPKDYAFLKTQGMEQFEVMEFRSTGFWKFMNPVMFPLKVGLLWGLNTLEKAVRNYGIAIMLLTVAVRILFWPVTHKSTESMRKMQALQPQLKALQAKYKDNPQRMQQEIMKFYRENKVNPMGGCLPMLIQIPVFIALFVVLRSAIELRFSKFLWIRDLSEPEHLLAGMVPLVGSLNILPLLMAATTVLQMRMTPSAGDPQQQKMMAVMMPVMMLLFCYTMPSGLILYWTTSNVIMIVQMLIKRPKALPAAAKS